MIENVNISLQIVLEVNTTRQGVNSDNTVVFLTRSSGNYAINCTTRACLFVDDVGEWCWPFFAKTVKLLSVITSLAYSRDWEQPVINGVRQSKRSKTGKHKTYHHYVLMSVLQWYPMRGIKLTSSCFSIYLVPNIRQAFARMMIAKVTNALRIVSTKFSAKHQLYNN